MAGKTKLDCLVARAVEIERRIAELPARRLTRAAFQRQANEAAGMTSEELAEFLKNLPRAPAVAGYVRDLAKLIEVGHLRNVPPANRQHRLLALAGQPVEGQFSLVDANPLRCLCAAVAHAKPAAFGTIDDLGTRDRIEQELRDELASLLRRMKTAVSGADIDFLQDFLNAQQRENGLALIRFKKWPLVAYASDWPSRVVREAIRSASERPKPEVVAESPVQPQPAPAPKPPRVRLKLNVESAPQPEKAAANV
jgi:hypothetical protein